MIAQLLAQWLREWDSRLKGIEALMLPYSNGQWEVACNLLRPSQSSTMQDVQNAVNEWDTQQEDHSFVEKQFRVGASLMQYLVALEVTCSDLIRWKMHDQDVQAAFKGYMNAHHLVEEEWLHTANRRWLLHWLFLVIAWDSVVTWCHLVLWQPLLQVSSLAAQWPLLMLMALILAVERPRKAIHPTPAEALSANVHTTKLPMVMRAWILLARKSEHNGHNQVTLLGIFPLRIDIHIQLIGFEIINYRNYIYVILHHTANNASMPLRSYKIQNSGKLD